MLVRSQPRQAHNPAGCVVLETERRDTCHPASGRRRWSRALARWTVLGVCLIGAGPALPETDHAARRTHMIRVIEAHARGAASALGRDQIDQRVLAVMGDLPRHLFVSERWRARAYDDRPLPIGYGQTISQPFIVALMTDLIDPQPHDVVLEVGTGSGYQAAVLAELVRRVCSIEIIPALGARAGGRFERLGYTNVLTMVGDGYYGWPSCGPFDGIVVTAAASDVPPPLVQQLKPGGRLVIPVGGPFLTQRLVLVEKRSDGRVGTRQLLPVRFVPLVRR